jgi:lipoyltransferase and lipoate-protein ligase
MVYIDTGSTDVYYNFGSEYYFATEKIFEDVVFLFWRTTPTLMVGKYQNVAEEINVKFAKEKNMNIVRRMSGGGTIYTDPGGWQFTFIDRDKDNVIEFKKYIAPVISALHKFGVNADFNGRNDLCIDNKKISGNAQYKLEESIIHHGSLLYDTDIESMVNATTVDSYKIISKSIKSVRDRVTNISEHIQNADLTAEDFKKAMVDSILQANDIKEVYRITPEDDKRIRGLATVKFNNWDSIYGRNPKFNIEKTGRFEGGKISFKLDVIHGKIESAFVSGDFFSTLDAKEIEAALIGSAFDSESVYRALKQNNIDKAIYKISISEIAKMIAD